MNVSASEGYQTPSKKQFVPIEWLVEAPVAVEVTRRQLTRSRPSRGRLRNVGMGVAVLDHRARKEFEELRGDRRIVVSEV